MAFKAVSRGGRLYFVPGALDVPREQGTDAQPARVEGDLAQVTFARSWAEVPLPEPAPVPASPPAPPPAPEPAPVVDASAEAEAPRSERRKGDRR